MARSPRPALPLPQLAILLALLLPGCSDDAVDPDPPRPAALRIAPDSVTFGALGDTARLTAEVTDQHGNPLHVDVSWSSTAPDLVGVDDTGLATALVASSFRATIEARAATSAGEVADDVPVIARISLCRAPAEPGQPGPVAPPPSWREAGPLVPQSSPYSQARLAAVDAEADGDMDILYLAFTGPLDSHRAGAALLLRNDGTGGFGRDSLSIPSDRIDGPFAPVTMDVDGDGLDDVFLGMHGDDVHPLPGAPNLVLVQTDGGFVERGGELLEPRRTLVTVAAGAADIECDGDLDVFEANPGSVANPARTQIRVNDGGLLRVDEGRLPAALVDDGTGAPAPVFPGGTFCDVDRDGDPDLALARGDPDEPHWLLLNDGFGSFERVDDRLPPKERMRQARGIACVDVDRDGWPDLAVNAFSNEPQDAEVQLWHNDGTGRFTDETATRLPQTWGSSGGFDYVESADFNGDGWPDIYAYGLGTTCEWAVFTNLGDGTFSQTRPIDTICDHFLPIDLDGDGRLEIVAFGNQDVPPILVEQR